MPSAPRLIFPAFEPIYKVVTPLTEPLVRVMAGAALAVHGYPILFGDIAASAKFFQSVGFDNAVFWAYTVGAVEFFAGLSFALGLLTRPSACAIIGFLAVAIVSYHWQFGFNWEKRGFEYPLFWLIVVFHFLVRGGGAWSLDAWIGREV